MWAVRVLNGPQAGQTFTLKPGKNIIGRNSGADIVIGSNGVSKEHCEIVVMGNQVVVSDLKSRNGVFVNGAKIHSKVLKIGDTIGLHQILLAVVVAALQPTSPSVNSQVSAGAAPSSHDVSYQPPQNFFEKLEHHLQSSVLPAFTQLSTVFEMKVIVFGFMMIFVFAITILSVFPMKQVTSESIQTESRRRALTIARALSGSNERAIRQGNMNQFSADSILREEGIEDVFIVSKDGTIIAPPERAGGTPKQAGFIKKIKAQNREFAEVVGDKVLASSPILIFDPDLQQNTAKAHAVIVYDQASLNFDDERVFSLFIQMLVISLILGAALFYILFKVLEWPVVVLKQELDLAIKDRRSNIELSIKSPVVQDLVVTLNSLIARQDNQSQNASAGMSVSELQSIVSFIGFPSFAVGAQREFIDLNNSFENTIGVSKHQLIGQSIVYIPDQALQKNLMGLIDQVNANPQFPVSDRIDLSGVNYQIQCQGLKVGNSGPEYFLFVFMPENQNGYGQIGGAA